MSTGNLNLVSLLDTCVRYVHPILILPEEEVASLHP